MALPRMSHSRYADLARCGELYRLKRIERVPTTPSIYSAAGTAFHAWTDMFDTSPPWDVEQSHEDWYRDRLLKEVAELEERTEFPLREWDNPQFKADANERQRDKFLNELGPDMIRKYIEWRAHSAWQVATINGAPAIELELTFSIDGVEFIVLIDRIFERPEEGDLVIIDTKTWSKKRVTAQLPTYTFAARREGFNVGGAGYYSARAGEVTNLADYKYWDENRIAALYVQAAHMISERWFLPNPSEACRMCDVKRHCSFYLD